MAKHFNKTYIIIGLLGAVITCIVWTNRREFFTSYNYGPLDIAGYGEDAYERRGAPPGFSNADPDILRNRMRQRRHNQYYPNLTLPSTVVGGGYRMGGLLGGSQIGIPNVLPPIDISNQNIAPTNIINIPTSYPINNPSTQIGVMYKIFGAHNDVHPLYGRRTDRNRWEYHSIINGVRVPVNANNRYDIELGNNDKVHMNGHDFRVTKYEPSLQYAL
jgi:hypothetical protein